MFIIIVVGRSVRSAYGQPAAPRVDRNGASMPPWLRLIAPALGPGARHDLFEKHAPGYFFNRGTHEKDMFDQGEVRRRVAKWSRSLAA